MRVDPNAPTEENEPVRVPAQRPRLALVVAVVVALALIVAALLLTR